MKGKSLLAAGFISGVIGLACERDITSPILEEPIWRTSIHTETYNYSNEFDTPDAIISSDVNRRLNEIQNKYPNLEINPQLFYFDGKEYALGFNISGEGKVEITEKTRKEAYPYEAEDYASHSHTIVGPKRELGDFTLTSKNYIPPVDSDSIIIDLDYIVTGKREKANYQRLDFYMWPVDAPDVPKTNEVLERLKKTNELYASRNVKFSLIYLNDSEGNTIINEKGEIIVNAVKFEPTGSNAGDSFMGDYAIYIMTGQEKTYMQYNREIQKSDISVQDTTSIPNFPRYDHWTGEFIYPDSTN